MKPLLSIIIPCYNCDQTLREAVDSCYTQGFSEREFEIVLVDDCSSDTTKSLLLSLAQEKKNVRAFFHNQNQGGGATRNTATDHARADVVFCLDSDDVLPPHTLNKMLSFLQAKDADGVGVHHSKKFKGTNITDIGWEDTFAYAGEQIPIENLLQQHGTMCSLYSVFMYTKKAFYACGRYPTHHGFDTQGFAWRFLAAGLKAYTCPNTCYLHRINFHQSYYLREDAGGKINFNWQLILLEHTQLFTPDTLLFIKNYKVRDFTSSLYADLCAREKVFVDESIRKYKPGSPALIHHNHSPISRSSLQGIYLRLKKKVLTHRIKNLLLQTLFFYQDIEARLHSSKRISLLIAYMRLRIQKLLNKNFATIGTLERLPVDIVIPTISKDFVLLSEYLHHIRENVNATIGTIYVVAADNNNSLQRYCDENNLTFIDEKLVLGYGKEAIEYTVNGVNRSGWLFQQLLKLSGESFVKNEHYLIVDADTLLIKPHSFYENGKVVFFENTEWHEPYFSAFKKLFGYDARHPLSLTSHMMLFSVTKLRLMKAEIEKRHATSWDKAYLSACDRNVNSGISDYDTYAQWVLYNFPTETITKPFYNLSFSRKKFGDLGILKKMYARDATSFSFHSYNP